MTVVLAASPLPIEEIAPLTAEASSGVAAIYRDHYRDIYRYVLAMTRSSVEAEDVTAETFERAIRSWSVSEPSLPWLITIARRLWTDRWRRARRWAGRIPRVVVPSSASEDTSTVEFWAWFASVTRALPQRQREVLVLRYSRDLSDRDIARILGISEAGVRSAVRRALETLRRHPELL